jgi:small-conductance mechanosensitive channel
LLIPHLLFAHTLADYALQTNWLVSQKGKGWFGLLLHGGTVGFMSLLTLAPYLGDVWLPLCVLVTIHTLQDYLKVRFGPHLKVHASIPYMGDQLLHYALIGVIQLWVGDSLSPEPAHAEIVFMWTGTAVMVVTRY